MQKERAASALRHGLPVPDPLPTRVLVSVASGPRSSPGASVRSHSGLGPSSRQSMPMAVKLLGVGLGLLGLVYGLTLLRDRASSPEPAPLPANMTGPAIK